MPDARACCVLDCNSDRKHPGFIFPCNSIRGQKWLEILKVKFTYEEARRKKYRVCTKHFRLMGDYYPCDNGRRHQLKADAVPCLNLPVIETSEQATKNEANNNNGSIDYSKSDADTLYIIKDGNNYKDSMNYLAQSFVMTEGSSNCSEFSYSLAPFSSSDLVFYTLDDKKLTDKKLLEEFLVWK